MSWNSGLMQVALNHNRRPFMTVETAHTVMQKHLDCPVTICAVKRQARDLLVTEKRMVLDSGRARE